MTAEQHFVSIIIPVYNGEKFLASCTDNILRQTYQNYEVIFIVDERSNDESLKIVNLCSTLFLHSKILIQDNGERQSGARNIGIDNSEGDVLCFLDVDDYQYPYYLEEMLKIMDEHDSDTVFCNHYQLFERTIPEDPMFEYSVTDYDTDSAISVFTDFPVYPWSRIQRREIFKSGECYFYNHPSSEDIEQTIRTLVNSKKVSYYSRPLCVYYKNKDSATLRCRQTDAESIEAIAERMLPYVRSKCPFGYDGFERCMIERVMRQIAFVDYKNYMKAYKNTFIHKLMKDTNPKTIEMKVFMLSGTLYYVALYVFTHKIWDEKIGLWKDI